MNVCYTEHFIRFTTALKRTPTSFSTNFGWMRHHSVNSTCSNQMSNNPFHNIIYDMMNRPRYFYWWFLHNTGILPTPEIRFYTLIILCNLLLQHSLTDCNLIKNINKLTETDVENAHVSACLIQSCQLYYVL